MGRCGFTTAQSPSHIVSMAFMNATVFLYLARSFGRKSESGPKSWPVKVMTVGELSAYLHVHRSTIYRLVKRHEIPAFRIGSDWRFNIEAIDHLGQQNLNARRNLRQ
jgi:excisionase family DNA binding protein